jgi:aldose 1-epimerase
MENLNCRFLISKEDFGSYSLYKLKDNKTGEYVSIIPDLGGSINNLVLKQNDKLVDIIDGYKSMEDAKENLLTSFKGSNLYPFPNRIEGGKYSFKEQLLHLNCNFPQENNAIHGLVYDQPFDVISKEDGDFGCTLVLRYIVTKPLPGYPYNNMIEVNYKWNEENQFVCSTKITNLSDDLMPVGHGWHPYFIAGNTKVDELYIQFPSKEILEVNDKGIPTGKKDEYISFNELKPLGKTNFDSCFLLSSEDKEATILIENKKENIKYKIWQENGVHKYNYLQVYTPPSRESIAFEPMTCSPNAFNTGEGLIVLAPQERITINWGIKSID